MPVRNALLSAILFNLFLEKFMQETLHDHHTPLSIGGRSIRFADNIDLVGGSKVELQDLTNSLFDRTRANGMEVSTERSKTMTNSTNNIGADISMNGQKLEDMISFKYLGATLCKDGTCSAEIRVRIVSAMTRLNRIWRSNTIGFASKFKLYKSLVASILLYGCEIWTKLDDSEKRIQAFETECLRELLRVSYLEHKTNDWVRGKINFLARPQESLLATATR